MNDAYADLYMIIDGEKVGGAGRAKRPVHNPATGGIIGQLPMATADDLDRALSASQKAFGIWRRVSAYDRADILKEAAQNVRRRLADIARLVTLEEGKVLADAKAEVAAAADTIQWYAEEGRRAYGRLVPARAANLHSMVLREPIGPVAVFTPWNFPAAMPARKIAPALAAGCSCIIKAAEDTPASCLAIVEAFIDAGIPQGLVSAVFGDPAMVSRHLVTSPVIRKVSFTGSVPVGREIARLAAAGPKPATLELGGHAPVLVLADADPSSAAAASAASKFRNAGQICTSPTRFIVHEAVYDRFLESFASAAGSLRLGDGLAADTTMGPLAMERRIGHIDGLVSDAVRRGARLVSGGRARQAPGFFYEPTILADVPLDAEVNNCEPFGPVAVVSRVGDEEAAVKEANRLPFGLAAYILTAEGRAPAGLLGRIEAGIVGVNTYAISMAETPFGGVKDSGYGSEGGKEGLDGFLVSKYVAAA